MKSTESDKVPRDMIAELEALGVVMQKEAAQKKAPREAFDGYSWHRKGLECPF